MADGGVHRAPYYAAEAIAGTVSANWETIDGAAATHGVDILTLDVDRGLNLAVSLISERMKPEDLTALQRRWYMKPAGYEPTVVAVASKPDPVDAEEGAAFGAFLGAHSALSAKVGR